MLGPKNPTPPLSHTMTDNDGTVANLRKYRGARTDDCGDQSARIILRIISVVPGPCDKTLGGFDNPRTNPLSIYVNNASTVFEVHLYQFNESSCRKPRPD